jgi:hypothetical protein
MRRRRLRKYYTVFLDEWVRVRNLMNRHYHACRPCSICRRFACEPVWYSIKSGEVRCLKCFDPVTEHDRRELERPFDPIAWEAHKAKFARPTS